MATGNTSTVQITKFSKQVLVQSTRPNYGVFFKNTQLFENNIMKRFILKRKSITPNCHNKSKNSVKIEN